MSQEPVSYRILIARFQSRMMNITKVKHCISSEASDTEEKEVIYEKSIAVKERLPKCYLVAVIFGL